MIFYSTFLNDVSSVFFYFLSLFECCKCIQMILEKFKQENPLNNLQQKHNFHKLCIIMFFIATRVCWYVEINFKTFILRFLLLSIAFLIFFTIIEFFLQWLICIAIVEQCSHSLNFENKRVRWSYSSSSRSCKLYL